MELAEVIKFSESVLAEDPRPDDLRAWERDHPDTWIRQRPYYRFLYGYAKQVRPAIMVELGSDHGYGAWHMARGNQAGKVVAVDVTFDRFEPMCLLANVSRVQGDSVLMARALIDALDGPIGLLMVDSEHTHKHAAAEFKAYDKACAPGALQVFDDINHPAEMRAFWADLPGPKAELNALHPNKLSGEVVGLGVRVKP